MNSEIIKRYREARSLSQEDLGELVGVGKTAVAGWEKGKPISGPALKLLDFLINDVHPFGEPKAKGSEAWDISFSLKEWKELEHIRIKHGFKTVEDFLAWVVRQSIKSST